MVKTMMGYEQARRLYEAASEKAVGIIVKHPQEKKILLLEELNTKLHLGKIAGMRSLVLETALVGEPIKSTLRRAMAEEAPGIQYLVEKEVGYYQVVSGVWALLYVVQSISPDLPLLPPEADIADPKWVNPSEALDKCWLRQGVPEMISGYLAGQHNVCCMECSEASYNPP